MAEEDTGKDQLEELISGLPLDEKVPVVALKKLLDQRHELENQENAEIEAINRKYLELTEPLSQRVASICYIVFRDHQGKRTFCRGVEIRLGFLGWKTFTWRIRKGIQTQELLVKGSPKQQSRWVNHWIGSPCTWGFGRCALHLRWQQQG